MIFFDFNRRDRRPRLSANVVFAISPWRTTNGRPYIVHLNDKSNFEATKKGADAPFSYKDLLIGIIVVDLGGSFKLGVVCVNFDIFPLFFTSGVVYCFKA